MWCHCRITRGILVTMTTMVLSSALALDVDSTSQGVVRKVRGKKEEEEEEVCSLGGSLGGNSPRNVPSVASIRNYSSPPHLSSAPRSAIAHHETRVPATKLSISTPRFTARHAAASLEEAAEVINFDDNNATLSDHTFQQLIKSNQHSTNTGKSSKSNSFLVKLSSYLLSKNSQEEKKSKTPYDMTKAYTPQPLSFNTPNPPSTISKPFVHPAERHPPSEDYLGPIQFQSSLTQSIIHHNGGFPRVKDTVRTKEPSTTSLYLQWDRDSAEQEVEAEKNANLTIIKPMWFLLALSGNETIAKLRREDFVKYVRVNVASRLSMQYDEVKVVRLQLSPRILMNISIASSRKSPVMALLAADTAPLLELSGEEYIIAPLEDPATAEHQTGVVPLAPEGSQDDLEAAVCALAGGACALAAGAALLVAALFRRQRPRNDLVINRTEPLCLPPAVIYTGRLENNEFKDVQVINAPKNLKFPAMDPRVQPDTLPLDARFVEELGLDNPNFLTP
ncbi:hypothetical protein B566_EDAN008727 [Ephemera danica]|nr:hypothetical protein B566_EDAN008727 [Ephemera danica]